MVIYGKKIKLITIIEVIISSQNYLTAIKAEKPKNIICAIELGIITGSSKHIKFHSC